MQLPRGSRRSRVAKLLIASCALLLIASMLFVSVTPSVEARRRPSARDLHAARAVWQQLKSAQGGATELRMNDQMIGGFSALARDGLGLKRLDFDLSGGAVRGGVSLELPLGLWLNASAVATGRHQGFPAFQFAIGRLTLPTAVGRPLANLARWILQANGAEIPHLDEMVESFVVEEKLLRAKVRLPTGTGLVDSAIAARSNAVDYELVEAVLCRISSEQRAAPVVTMSELTRRAFADRLGGAPDRHARAAFAALSLAVVGERAEALFARGLAERKQCSFPSVNITLQGRADLAKHWVLSAALTAVLGQQAAERLGEWKELDDSRPHGSGFSFVDLAADRAGVQIAMAALDQVTALATREKLRRATEDDLLPSPLLGGPEGLSEAAFLEQFGSLEKKNYRTAVSIIDAILVREMDSKHRTETKRN